MAQLIVRNLEADVVTRLKRRAAANGRSMEAEHREILRVAVNSGMPGRSFKQALLAMPDGGDDSDFDRQADQGRRIEL